MKEWFASLFNPIRLALIVIAAIMLWFIIWGDQGIYQREKLRYLRDTLSRDEHNTTSDINKLKDERKFLKNDKNLESVIRKELRYIKPGEIIYELKSKEPPPDLAKKEAE